MATFVVPFKVGGKTRLGDPEVAEAMLRDVVAACEPLGRVIVADEPVGQGEAIARALADVEGTVAIVNSDLPCATTEELERLLAAAPALVAAADGTTNAISLRDARDFEPLYGSGSAARFERALGATRLDLPGLVSDVDTSRDLVPVHGRLGPHTRAAVEVRV